MALSMVPSQILSLSFTSNDVKYSSIMVMKNDFCRDFDGVEHVGASSMGHYLSLILDLLS